MDTRIAILGAGNIGGAIARGLVNARLCPADRITLTRRKVEGLEEFRRLGCRTTAGNSEAIAASDLVFVAVTPQQLNGLLAQVKSDLDPRRHTVVSIVSGASIAEIREQLSSAVPVVRALPNTAIPIRQSMTCLAAEPADAPRLEPVKTLFDALGKTLVIEEALMVPATALCACGIAFFLRAVRAASQGGIEIGFHPHEALLLAAQTAKGAAGLLLGAPGHPESEIDKVTTPRGCTIAGLNRMDGAQHAGMIVGPDNYAIDVFPFQQLPVIVVNPPGGLSLGGGVFRPLAIANGYGNDFGAFRQLIDQEAAPVADTDHTYAYTIVRANRRARQEKRKGPARHCSVLEHHSPCYLFSHRFFLQGAPL